MEKRYLPVLLKPYIAIYRDICLDIAIFASKMMRYIAKAIYAWSQSISLYTPRLVAVVVVCDITYLLTCYFPDLSRHP